MIVLFHFTLIDSDFVCFFLCDVPSYCLYQGQVVNALLGLSCSNVLYSETA